MAAPRRAGAAMPAKQKVELEVEGHRVPVSNFDKVLYPETGFTKGDVIRYYIDIGPWLLPPFLHPQHKCL